MATQTLVALPQQQREGSFQTGSLVVSEAMPATGEIQILPTIAAADFADPLNSLWIRFYWLDQGVWRTLSGMQWVGGGDPADPEQQPMTSLTVSHIRGKTVRAEIDIPRRMRVGVNVNLETFA